METKVDILDESQKDVAILVKLGLHIPVPYPVMPFRSKKVLSCRMSQDLLLHVVRRLPANAYHPPRHHVTT